jgi:hypothetical protein
LPKILFITTHNLVSNPRLVKEIKLALQHNYKVEVICYIFRNWSYEMNEDLRKDLKSQNVVFHCLEAGKEGATQWLGSVTKEKWNRLLAKTFSLKNSKLANAVSRRNHGLVNTVKKIKSANWVIGHNPGALWATIYAGKKLNCKMGFDVEDYHPGEGHNQHLQQLTKDLMQQVLPKMDYVSFAAPLIMEAVEKDLKYNDTNWFTILNYFPANEFALPETNLSGPIKLVWFSQNINVGRGLELILPFVKSNPEKVELHLYGNVNEDFKKKYLEGLNNIFLHGAVSQIKLHGELANFDIGLALDIPTHKNRELAVTNKLLAYLQAGLYVLASDTKSQESFMASFPDMGICFDYAKNDSKKILETILRKMDSIRSNKRERFGKFKNNNWETESKKLVNTWDSFRGHDGN